MQVSQLKKWLEDLNDTDEIICSIWTEDDLDDNQRESLREAGIKWHDVITRWNRGSDDYIGTETYEQIIEVIYWLSTEKERETNTQEIE